MYDLAAYYFLFADAFGWTPSEVDDQPVLFIEAMLEIFQVRAEERQHKGPPMLAATGQLQHRRMR